MGNLSLRQNTITKVLAAKSINTKFSEIQNGFVSRDTFGQEPALTKDYFNKLKMRYVIQYKANFVNSKNEKREMMVAKKNIVSLKDEIQSIINDIKLKQVEAENLKSEHAFLAENNRPNRDITDSSWLTNSKYASDGLSVSNSYISPRQSVFDESEIDGKLIRAVLRYKGPPFHSEGVRSSQNFQNNKNKAIVS